ncbi:MAG: hypothetical protein LQ345_001182 [Seirophora villosa]|nr:MAG: hypothetical protein LQ345_001182 [Seirophora villosa]
MARSIMHYVVTAEHQSLATPPSAPCITLMKRANAIPLVAANKKGNPAAPMIRYAEPGEFTRRAFHNNRLDLTQIEALGDTLSAETERQRRIAVRSNSSVLSQKYESWRQQLLYARGELEALIDFSEDQHFDESPATLVTSVTEQVVGLQRQIQAAMENASKGELLRNGISLALLGAPNAGKSSLLNQIVGREAAIVSEEAGTTRDVIDVGVDVGGFYCTFGDLAGLRGKSAHVGRVEQEGMRRARERALVADVIIVLVPVERRQSGDGTWHSHLELDAEIAATLNLCDTSKQRVVYAINKIDLIGPSEDIASMQGLTQQQLSDQDLPASPIPILAVSSQDSADVQHLLASLTGLFQDMTATSELDSANWESSLGASQRQRLLLEQCFNQLRTYLEEVDRDLIGQNTDDESVDVVLAAESLRSAADCLAKITGTGQVANIEEVLGVVFENASFAFLRLIGIFSDLKHEMHVVNLLTVLACLLFIASPINAVPLTISSQPASPRALPYHLHQQRRPRNTPNQGVFHFNYALLRQGAFTHHATFVQLQAFYPVTSAIIRAIGSIYFEIFFNLSPLGSWANIPPMNRVVIHVADIYLEFLSPNPQVPVPWSLVKHWAEMMDLYLNMGGFVGSYVASFERIVGDEIIDFWVSMHYGPPPPLAAAAAKMKRLKE